MQGTTERNNAMPVYSDSHPPSTVLEIQDPLTLKHASLIKVSTDLWSGIDMRRHMLPYMLSYMFEEPRFFFVDLQETVQMKVDALGLPLTVKQDLEGVLEMVGAEIRSWLIFHQSEGISMLVVANCYRWTPQGRIDKKKTVTALLEGMSPLDIYKLACLHCLVPELTVSWEQLSLNARNSYFHCELCTYWSQRLEFESPTEELFMDETLWDNELASCYIFSLLDRNTKISRINEMVDYFGKAVDREYTSCFRPYMADVLRGLLPTMEVDDRNALLKAHLPTILLYFIEWSHHAEFRALLERGWPVSEKNVIHLAQKIQKRANENCLFQPLWEYYCSKFPAVK